MTAASAAAAEGPATTAASSATRGAFLARTRFINDKFPTSHFALIERFHGFDALGLFRQCDKGETARTLGFTVKDHMNVVDRSVGFKDFFDIFTSCTERQVSNI